MNKPTKDVDENTSPKILVFLTLALIGFTIYSNALHGEFVSDDYQNIVDNPAVKNIRDLAYLGDTFNTRFLVGVSFALNYAIGEFNVFGYHLVNIIIHILNSFLVYTLVLLTLTTPFFKGHFLNKNNYSLAMLAALIFLCHPIQTQAVSFITQRAVTLATFFYLATLIFYIKARLQERKYYFFFAFGTMLLGMLTKEMMMTIPLSLTMYEIFFLNPGKIYLGRILKYLFPFSLIWVLLPLILSLDKIDSLLSLKYQLLAKGFSWNYFFTEANVIRTYLRLFILPVNLHHDYDYPVAQGPWEPGTLFSLSLIGVLIFTAFYLFSRHRVISFCVGWFFITIAVEISCQCFVQVQAIFEHWIYLAMVGFSLFVSYVLHQFIKKEIYLKITGLSIILILSFMTYQRNFFWQNEILFWQDNVKKAPNKAGPYFALGRAYERKEMLGLALFSYQKALLIDPACLRALNNVGLVYTKKGNFISAKKYFEKILILHPGFYKAYNNLAFLNFLEKNYREAIRYYQESLKHQGDYSKGLFYLGQSYLALGEKKKAEEYLTRALVVAQRESEWDMVKEIEMLLKQME